MTESCPFCGADVRQSDAVCPACGKPLVRELPRRFFLLSCEAYADTAYAMTEIFNRMQEALSDLAAADYGDEIEEISVIPICVPDSMPRPERRFVSHQHKYADMRLRIPYALFRQANGPTKYRLCLQAILDAVAVVDARTHKNGFRGKELAAELHRRLDPQD